MKSLPQQVIRARIVHSSHWLPSGSVEYLCFFNVFYSLMAVYLGIQVPLLATAIWAGLAGLCLIRLWPQAKEIYGPLGWLFACGISLIVIQFVVHDEPLLSDTNRAFINWMVALVVVHALNLRQGFLHRLALLLFVLGSIVIPHLSFDAVGFERARIDVQVSGHLTNPIGLAEWFGFCMVYFSMYGLETKRIVFRVGSWLLAVACFYVVALTVSRGPLIASALAITVGFRSLLGRGFVPLLLLLVFSGVVYESGLFEHAISIYAERGTEESGRERLWPEAVQRISNSPLLGVGVAKVGSDVLNASYETPPHNSFLYFALSSGVVPFVLYVIFWIQAAWRSFSHVEGSGDGAFRLPLLIFTFVVVMLGDTGFMSPWALLSLSFAAGSNVVYKIRELILVPGSRNFRMLLRDHPKPTN